MKGLILKDLYTVKGFGKQYFLVLCFMILCSVCMKSTSFPAMYAMLLGGMLVLTTMSVDEAAHFNTFALTMPVNTSTLVKAKYLLLVLSIGSGIVIGILFNSLTFILPFFQDSFEIMGILAIGTIFIVTYAVTLPIIYKYGIEKARYTYILIMLALAAVIVGGLKVISLILGVSMTELPAPPEIYFYIILVVVNVLSIVISYQVALKVVAKKEW